MTLPLALIIEDDRRSAHIFSVSLERADFETEIIREGKAAMERLNGVVPELIVLDLHLPEVSGKEILHRIRSDERFAQTHIILATADGALAESLEAEVDLVLLKPISANQLRDLAARLNLPSARK